MEIKKDNQLEILSKQTGIEVSYLAETIIKKCTELGVIDGDPIQYGMLMIQAFLDVEANFKFTEMYQLILGVPCLIPEAIDAFAKLTILGDGDCPHCGGETEDMPGPIIQVNYDCEPYPESTKKTCKNCKSIL